MTRVIRSGWFLASAPTAQRTMRRMASLVRDSLDDPRVWETARAIVAGCGERDELGQAQTIRSWVQSHLRFVNDPAGVELVADPRYLLDSIKANGFVQGDCDDAASLTAALGSAVGIPAEFRAGALEDGAPFSHVWTVLYPRQAPGDVVRREVEMDTTRPAYVAQLPTFARVLTQRVTV